MPSLFSRRRRSLTPTRVRRFGCSVAFLLVAHALAACSRFVWHEDPFTPDQAPATETVVTGRDTMYVLRGSSYYLLASQRSALWNRDVMDDVAWRYRALFGDAPPLIAVRLGVPRDSALGVGDTATTWRQVPLATVVVRRRGAAVPAKNGAERERERQIAPDDSVRIRLFVGSMLGATAAETWLRARAAEAVRVPDGQPGGPSHEPDRALALPAWIEAGALRILGASGAPGRAAAELRADSKHILPLASLFGVRWAEVPNVAEIVRAGAGRFELDEDGARPRRRDLPPGASGVSPLFIAQSVSVLSFLHERDPELVGRLVDELARGRAMSDVFAMSTRLPRDIAALDAEWRTWERRSARRR